MSARQSSYISSRPEQPQDDSLRDREARRLRFLSKILMAALAAGVTHILVSGADAQTVLAAVVTTALLAACLWLLGVVRLGTGERSERKAPARDLPPDSSPVGPAGRPTGSAHSRERTKQRR